jgi:hypothetical protein
MVNTLKRLRFRLATLAVAATPFVMVTRAFA